MSEYYCPHADLGCSHKEKIFIHQDRCPGCGRQLEFPNVRAALSETEELQDRYKTAQDLAEADGSLENLKHLGMTVLEHSKACRNDGTQTLKSIMSDREPYKTFYQRRSMGVPYDDEDEINQTRESVDALFFPGYHQKIAFASLTLNGIGLENYGGHTITFKNDMIRHRATVFESNSYTFPREQKLLAGQSLPRGYRACWDDRGTLAEVKLQPDINKNSGVEEFSKLLLVSHTDSLQDQFIEVHIYEGFNRSAVEQINFGKTRNKPEALIVDSIEKEAQKCGIACQRPESKGREEAA